MFCECGALICFSDRFTESVECRRCSAQISISTNRSSKIIINNIPNEKLTTVKKFSKSNEVKEIKVSGAKIKMQCPGCGVEELSYNTAQLRSADEGQTVFLKCEKCGFKDTVNS